jgi:hypothetical protein
MKKLSKVNSVLEWKAFQNIKELWKYAEVEISVYVQVLSIHRTVWATYLTGIGFIRGGIIQSKNQNQAKGKTHSDIQKIRHSIKVNLNAEAILVWCLSQNNSGFVTVTRRYNLKKPKVKVAICFQADKIPWSLCLLGQSVEDRGW